MPQLAPRPADKQHRPLPSAGGRRHLRARRPLRVGPVPASPPERSRAGWLVAVAVASVVVHAFVWVALTRWIEPREIVVKPKQEILQVAVVEAPPPPPPPEPEPPPPPPPPPEPVKIARPPPKPKVKPPPIAEVAPPPPPDAPPPDAPPPPNTEAAEPSKAPPVVISGISMSSTSTAGSFSVNVGNTLYGRPDSVAKKPEEVKPYKAEKYAPPHMLTEPPVFLDNVSYDLVRKYYPDEAKQAEIEAQVLTRLTIDADGTVVKVVVVKDPGHGFADAVRKLAKLYRFKPAKVNGEAVATEVPFTVRFELDY